MISFLQIFYLQSPKEGSRVNIEDNYSTGWRNMLHEPNSYWSKTTDVDLRYNIDVLFIFIIHHFYLEAINTFRSVILQICAVTGKSSTPSWNSKVLCTEHKQVFFLNYNINSSKPHVLHHVLFYRTKAKPKCGSSV